MPYDPARHHRRSIRLRGYDYSQNGLYFITICCFNMESKFVTIKNGEMTLNLYGKIAYQHWLNLAERFSNFQLDVFQIMPNHMHAILVLNDKIGGWDDGSGVSGIGADGIGASGIGADRVGASPTRTGLGRKLYISPVDAIIGSYKSLVFNECLEIFKANNEWMGKFWQRNYYEHIIRDEKSYQNISKYIINNPASWGNDKFYR